MKAIRDVSCTNSLHYDSELRGAAPNPLDFMSVMEKIRGKTGSFFFFFFLFFFPMFVILLSFSLSLLSERLICFHIKKMKDK